jgi:hypothetical protein
MLTKGRSRRPERLIRDARILRRADVSGADLGMLVVT